MKFILFTLLFVSVLHASDAITTSLVKKNGSPGQVIDRFPFTFSYIPAGEFMMGSPLSEKGRGRDEAQVKVTISEPFLMLKTEVTQGQWLQIMGTTIEELIHSKADPLGRGANLKNHASAEGADHPMCFVSYDDALEFCITLTQKDRVSGVIPEGYYYSLPTEAEWEYAARSGTVSVFSSGDTLTSDEANFYGILPYGVEQEGVYRGMTTPVKTFQPNTWGLFDVHGNVYEWCLDWYTELLQGGVDPKSLTEGDSRIIRGGPWNRKATSLRSAYRYSYDPSQRTNNIGFRIVLKAGEASVNH